MEISTSSIVYGEAPESDNEDEQNLMKGSIYSGEAPESDIEEGLDTLNIKTSEKHSSQTKFKDSKENLEQSLFKKMLINSNRKFHQNLNDAINRNIDNNHEKLLKIDQQLLNTQLKIQSAINCLKLVNKNINEFNQHLDIIVSANYLPEFNKNMNNQV